MRPPTDAVRDWFPKRAVLELVAGFALVGLLAQAIEHDPLASLPSEPPRASLRLPDAWERPPAAGELRIAVVGASETIGYPYGKEVSFARLLEKGLAAVSPDARVSVEPFGGTALDSPRIAKVARQALVARPRVLVVVLGGLELASRVFAGKELVPESALGRVLERISRPRLLVAGLAAGTKAEPDQDRVLVQLRDQVGRARPGRPALGGLPVGECDREALRARLAQTIDALAGECAAAGVRLILATAPQNELSPPFGSLAADGPEPRAARDADPAPLHGTSVLDATIRARAAAHGLVCFDAARLDLEFLDALHPVVSGHVALAAALAEQLQAARVLTLPVGWEAPFRSAAAEHVARVLPAEHRRDHELQARWGDALFHMLCGNFAGALPQVRTILRTLEDAPASLQEQQVQDMSGYALLCALGIARRVEAELPRAAVHADALRTALRSHATGAWLDGLLR